MSDPAPYIVSYSFSDFQSNNPAAPLPAPPLDAEFADIATAVAALVNAVKDVRRADGALNNGVVTFEALDLAVQLMLDPSNATLVANAVATAQAAATAASASNTSAGVHDTAAAASAAAAAASASSVNLTLFFPKAGNLAGIGNPNVGRDNLSAAARDGSDATGRWAALTGFGSTDWNSCDKSGWYCNNTGTANGPDAGSTWLAQVIAVDAFFVTQIAYSISNAPTSTSAVQIFRRHSYNNAGVRTWQPWESAGPLPVGSTVWINGLTAPPGFLKENGALISRASFPALYAYAAASGNIVSEATWSGGSTGGFSTGDLTTTFRLPDARGEFIRAYDDSRGVDAGRAIAAHQADSLKDHTHVYNQPASFGASGAAAGILGTSTPANTGSPSTGAAAETRGRNNAKLACIKY